MAVPPNTGMKTTEMRKLLVRSKEEPVTCAVGQGDAGGLMLLDKRKPGRALETALKAEFPDARNTRFGTAFVDVDDNPKLVKLTLNKPVTGMAKRLIKTLKGTGFSKVIILTEDGSVMEQFEEEDEAAPVEAEGTTAAAPPAPEGVPVLPSGGGEPEAEKAASAAELSARLAALAARITAASAGNAPRQEELARLARQGNVEIQTNNLRYAANTLSQLEKALGAAPPPPPPQPATAPADNAARAAALSKELAELVPGIAPASAGDSARQADLAKLAKDANVQIKTGNLTYATNFIEQLRTALATAPTAPPPPAPPPPAPGATPQQKADDAAALSKQLAALIPGIATSGNGDAVLLTKLAKDANVEIKTGNLAYAANTIARLRTALAQGAPADAGPIHFKQRWASSFEAFRDAIETVDKQMEALGTACRKSNDLWFANIADRGLPAVTGNFKTPLMAACLEVGNAAPDSVKAPAAKAQSALANFAKHIASDPKVAGCDGNPFGVPVSIRATLAPALKTLSETLRLAS